MLQDKLASQNGSAWLRNTGFSRALRVERRGSDPQSGRCSFYAPDFALAANEPWLLGEESALSFDPTPLPALTHKAEPSSAEFAQLHEEILRRIKAREFEKVVPIVCEEMEFAAPLQAAMFGEVIGRDHPLQYTFGFEMDDEGLVGVTPELLFSVKDGVLRTMALAGTGKVNGPSLLEDRKERHEHQIVIEHILAELRNLGSPSVGETGERAYGSLKHLHTPLEVKLNAEPRFLDLVVRLHPTAALGGWPRRPAIEWLERQSFHSRRHRFGAPFGFLAGDEMACVVGIRCLQWWGRKALLAAGCGVVEESQALREWQELQLKRDAVCRLLGVAR